MDVDITKELGRLQYSLRGTARPWLEIDWVECHDDRAGQGIARALMEYAIENIAIKDNHVDQRDKSEKVGYVRLESRYGPRNRHASSLYTNLGFVTMAENEDVRQPRMELDLRCYESGDSRYTLPTLSKAPWKLKKKCNIL
ncbi:hypothetical protein DdX_12600 [Ditylenchus destructor]|uniref:N-acetyltransferase domain-containing protein n=1 Tax=Ditylenchus destructor TaxID=166010 RepID=A0AAD4MUD7_9BILA|nr:hypothetical protein DdX_12600 [Ditylenchus destructor]